jgi:filamentous hemagglutinin
VVSNGKVIGRDGMPIPVPIKENPTQAHIPLEEYRKWEKWNSPQ